jgi:hypothetical protein
MIQKHFVTFVSPGTLFSETTTKEIASWNVEEATEMAKDIVERYNATPYCFCFTTRQNDGELDSKEVAKSVYYFLGGNILTLEEIKARNSSKDEILISNMEINKIDRVVENWTPWRIAIPINPGDVVLAFDKPK